MAPTYEHLASMYTSCCISTNVAKANVQHTHTHTHTHHTHTPHTHHTHTHIAHTHSTHTPHTPHTHHTHHTDTHTPHTHTHTTHTHASTDARRHHLQLRQDGIATCGHPIDTTPALPIGSVYPSW